MEELIFKVISFCDFHVPTSVYRFFHVLFRDGMHSFSFFPSLSPVLSSMSNRWAEFIKLHHQESIIDY